jgi:hypothetical protein
MAIFNLEKWYFDVFSPEYDYIFFYFAYTKILGHIEARLNLHIVPFKGTKTFSQSHDFNFKSDVLYIGEGLVKTKHGRFTFNDYSAEVNFHINGMSIDVLYEFIQNRNFAITPLRIRSGHNHMIRWHPISLKSRVSGEIKINATATSIGGFNGYIDYLYSDVFPLKAPVRTLYWGRIHHEECDLTYTYIEDQNKSKKWCKMIFCTGDVNLEFDSITITHGEWKYSEKLHMYYPHSYTIYGENSEDSLDIRVDNVVNAVESGFIDQQDVQSGIKRCLFKFLSKNPKGIKFISKSSLKFRHKQKKHEVKDVFFISEFVHFT